MEAASRAPLEPLEPLKDDGLDMPSVATRAESPANPPREGLDLDLALLGEEIPLAPLEELETPAPVSRASAEASAGKSPADVGAGKTKGATAAGRKDADAAWKPDRPEGDRSFDEGSVVDSDELLSAALSMTDLPETVSEPKAMSGASSGPSAEDFLSEPLTLSDDVPSNWMPGSTSASESASGSTSGAQKSAAGAAAASSASSPDSLAAGDSFAGGSSSSGTALPGGPTPASLPGGSSSDSPWGAGGLSLADDLPPIPDFDELPPLPPVDAAPVTATSGSAKASESSPSAAAAASGASRSSAAAEQVPSRGVRETSSSAAKRPRTSDSVAAVERSSSAAAAPREPSSSAPAAGRQERSPSSTARAKERSPSSTARATSSTSGHQELSSPSGAREPSPPAREPLAGSKSRAREGSASSSAARAPAPNAPASSPASRPSVGGEPSGAGTLSLVPPDSAPDIAPAQSPAAASTREAAARPTLSLPPQPAKPRTEISVSTAPAEGSPETASKPAAAPAAPIEVPTPAMDRDFIARNQIVERYISGKLPLKGATEFEKFCSDHPELLDELGLPERVNAGLRLLEAAGKPEPWQETPKKFWEKPHLVIGLGVATFVMLITLGVVWSGSSDKSTHIARLEKLVAEQPLEPATNTRTARVVPSYKGASNSPAITVGGPQAQLADLKIDVSKSAFRNFRVTIDRIDEGRVAILHNVAKDSNGHVRIAFNTSALGPGNYQLTLDGINWKGETQPDAWVTVGIAH